MSNLSDFLGGGSGGGGGIYLGYIETADGTFEKIANGAGVAYLDYSNGPVALSTDGVTVDSVYSDRPYLAYGNGLWLRKAGGYTAEAASSFSAPSSRITGVAFDASTGNLLSCDGSTDLVYIHEGVSGIILSSFAAPGPAITGITIDTSTGNLISCDGTDAQEGGFRRIDIHSGIGPTILNSFDSPGQGPSGLCVDPSTGNLIIADKASNRIYVQDGISSTTLYSFPAQDANGVAVDPSTGDLISCNSVSNIIYVHNQISDEIITEISSPSSFPTGLTINTTTNYLISCDRDSGLIYIHANLRKFALALTEAAA